MIYVPSPIVTDTKASHSANAYIPNSVTLLGILTEVIRGHKLNALLPILVTLFGIIMLLNWEQPERQTRLFSSHLPEW